MYKTIISVKHRGCWACKITKRFDCKLFMQNTVSLKPKEVSDILYIRAELKKQDKILQFINKQPFIHSIEILEKGDDYVFLLVTTSGNDTIIERINKSRCFLMDPTVLTAGHEILVVGAKTKENVTTLLNSLKEIGTVKLLSIVNFKFDRGELTQKQKNTLEHAYLNSYYEWPRKSDIEKLAKKQQISKSTYIEHLRKAEMKIIRQFIRSH